MVRLGIEICQPWRIDVSWSVQEIICSASMCPGDMEGCTAAAPGAISLKLALGVPYLGCPH